MLLLLSFQTAPRYIRVVAVEVECEHTNRQLFVLIFPNDLSADIQYIMALGCTTTRVHRKPGRLLVVQLHSQGSWRFKRASQPLNALLCEKQSF